MFNLYLVNDESVCERINSKKHSDFTISSNGFVSSDGLNDSIIFQMLKDTHFNIITSKTKKIEFHIVAVEHSLPNKKIKILEYFNENKKHEGIKPIIKFSDSISNGLSHDEKILKLSSSYNFEFVKSVLDKFLPDELILEVKKYLVPIEIEFMVNPYEGNLYISNPSFQIKKTLLRTLIKK